MTGVAMTSRARPGSASRWWRVAQIALAVILVVGVFIAVIPQIADYGSVWRRVSSLTGFQIAILVGVTAVNLLTYWLQSIAAMPGLNLRMAAVQNQTTTTVANTVPGGGAIAVGVSYGIFHSWGYTEGDFARFTLVTGIWNTAIKLVLPVIALGFLTLGGATDPRLAFAAAIGIVALIVASALVVLAMWKESFAATIGRACRSAVRPVQRLFRRQPARDDWGKVAVRFRRDSIALLRERGVWLTVSTIASHLSLFLVLLVSIRVVGVTAARVTWGEALAAFAFARLVSVVPLTPGGLGFVELSYVGALVWAGGDRIDVVAGTLLFRLLTFVLQIPLGAITYPIWLRTKDRWHRTDRRGRTRTGRAKRTKPAARRTVPA
jgi:putative heme transporter